MNNRLVVFAGILIVTTISGWITAFRMRRRARKALGIEIKDSELTSINTWMNVEEAEKRKPFGE